MHFKVLPAHAGMIPGWLLVPRLERRAPRTCGDDPALVGIFDAVSACSPHMRG